MFISDLHLNRSQPEIGRLFIDFLQWAANRRATLFILGDLFDAWIGDDAPDPAFQSILTAMHTYNAACGPIQLMHGNRDFLLGDRFCEQTGCSLLPDPHVITLNDRPVLLCHGDTLCIDDIAYQQFRRQVRDPQFIDQFLSKPIAERISIAQGLREQSRQATADKRDDIMDVNQAEVEKILADYQVSHMIHGHTHRLAHHQWTLGEQTAHRYVLGDWQTRAGNVLIAHNGEYRLLAFPELSPLG